MQIQAFWRDIRFLKLLAQFIFVIALALAAAYLYLNVSANLAQRGLTVGFGFLKNPASFDITHFHQIAKFFYGVGQLDRIINMENISLTEPQIKEGDEVVVKVSVLATAFRILDEAKGDKRGKPGEKK